MWFAVQSSIWGWLDGAASLVTPVIERVRSVLPGDILLAVLFFFFAFVIAAIPYLMARLIARHFDFRSIFYWLCAWVVIAAIWVVVAIWMGPDNSGLDNQPTLCERGKFVFLEMILPSICASLVCWFDTRKECVTVSA